jgi:hypothetical protein
MVDRLLCLLSLQTQFFRFGKCIVGFLAFFLGCLLISLCAGFLRRISDCRIDSVMEACFVIVGVFEF